jgi:hypothetical protein
VIAPLDYPDLIALKALMQLMLQAAQSGNWTELSRIDERRKALLEQGTDTQSESAKTSFTKDSAYIDLAETIKKLDSEIIASVVQARDGLANENRVLRDQVKAKAIYQQASTMRNVGIR